ncbi:MAG: SRPBCC domain-containing protein, partial [Myxococcota bacterium]
MTIEESFETTAPKDRVYDFLRDPEQCFPCLPGATFGQMYPDGKFDGKISVAVGPVKVSYDGWAVYEDEDPAAGTLVLKGEGREGGGAGIVKMNMSCSITETDTGTRVDVLADVGLAGKIIRFGRGLVRGIASQVFQDFTARARARLESAPQAEAQAAPAADPF